MKRCMALIVAALTLALGGSAWAQQEGYDAEGGVNWFGNNGNESWGLQDTYGNAYTTDDEWFDTEWFSDEAGFDEDGVFGFGEGENEWFGDGWTEDDYGYYDQNYEWSAEDEWFDDWYGESDEWF